MQRRRYRYSFNWDGISIALTFTFCALAHSLWPMAGWGALAATNLIAMVLDEEEKNDRV